ncbi:MAG: hypothetical protein B5M51_06475 [Anaerolinea sp. 4484_236]|nr:MAG: hypothetical protein B5M51_06475 [Anaerolinea sp. 4484_236]RLD11661.1 MAG: hypothetical protein DRI56_00660 [Chloroflexota bacterium]
MTCLSSYDYILSIVTHFALFFTFLRYVFVPFSFRPAPLHNIPLSACTLPHAYPPYFGELLFLGRSAFFSPILSIFNLSLEKT